MLSMRDVAERAGVSRSTVSVVLNGRADAVGINEDTRRRVLAAAHDLGYKRNALVRAVVTGRNRMLGFLASDLDCEPVARMLAGALDAAQERDHTLKILRLCDDRGDETTEVDDGRIIERCLELRLAGVIAVGMRPAPLARLHQEMQPREVPITIVGSSSSPESVRVCACVCADNTAGLRLIVEHLRGLGHARIAFISGLESSWSQGLEVSFRLAMREQKLLVSKADIEPGQNNIALTIEATRRLLQKKRPPTAIVCASDETALSACRGARAIGKRVPEDVSIVGFSDARVAALCDPPLSTVALPFEEMGAAAVSRTLERAEPQSFHGEPAEDHLPPRLVVRESTGVAR